MKTLVIHPDDVTTGFLEQIYAGKDWTVINDIQVSKRTLRKEIKAHDRIVMLGHGTKYGLFAKGRGTLIDSTYVHYLRDKQIVAIWCNADEFVLKYDLKGFYTGMIISEYDEADYLNIITNYNDIFESNVLFTQAMTDSIDAKDMLTEAKAIYCVEDTDNAVINYNKIRLYTR